MFSTWQIVLYYYIFSFYSKAFGILAHIPIPKILRRWVIGWYARRIGSRAYESVKPLEEFGSIYEYFIREIRPRPIDERDLVSPVDGIILCHGGLEEEGWQVRQIKQITYPVEDILGYNLSEFKEFKKLHHLHFVTIQLPVSECHRFRSPVDWTIKRRTHIPGTMFDLGINSLFNKAGVFYNERVILEGDWKHGKFFFIPFGSRLVGSICIYSDPELHTNVLGESWRLEEKDEVFKPVSYQGIQTKARIKDMHVQLNKGDEIGHFQGGSAFVLIFQHKHLEFLIEPPQFVTYGSPLGK